MYNKAYILLITGNGLDLNCGLKTSFYNYINLEKNNYINNKPRNINTIKELYEYSLCISKNNLSFDEYTYQLNIYTVKNKKTWELLKFNLWEILVILNSEQEDSNWFDVESVMKNFITEIDEDGKLIVSKINDIYKNVNKYELIVNMKNNFLFFILYVCNSLNNIEEHYHSFWECMYKELIKFENDFSMYVTSCIDKLDYNGLSYDDILLKKLNKLTNKELYNWLNFNYSNFSEYYEKPKNLIKSQNIHGTSPFYKNPKHAIIGIALDFKDRALIKQLSNNEQERIKMFSKQSRLNNENINHKLLSDTIKYIKFFGHSLSLNDAYYFYYIFNYYDICNSDIVVEFYYSIHGNSTEDQEKNKQLSRVEKLFKSYLNLTNQKIDVFHKMMDENRIIIKNIDVDD